MAKRRTELSTDIVMNFRINRRMKEIIDKKADGEGISSAEWMRRVLQDRIEREDSPDRTSFVAQDKNGNDVEFASIGDVERIVRRILKQELLKSD